MRTGARINVHEPHKGAPSLEVLPKLNKVLPIKLWYLDPMHQHTDVTNYPEHFSLFLNSLVVLISALKCLISVGGGAGNK